MKWTWWEDKQRRPWLIGGAVGLLLVILMLARCGDENSERTAAAEKTPARPPAQTAAPASAPEEEAQRAAAGATEGGSRAENRRPQVTAIRLTPALIYPGTLVQTEVVASDPEEKDVTLAYQWRKNGEAIAEATAAEYKVEGLRKGDLLQVTVTPTDDEQEGQAVNSLAAVIQNRPPAITSFPPAGLDNGRFRYAVTAEDPDGDKLTYALEQPPDGMTVDAATGVVEWDASAVAAGDFQVRLTVSDGEATSFQVFRLQLTRP